MPRKNKIATKNQIGQRVGRPAELDDIITRLKLFNAIKIGAHIETAIAFAGIHKDSFYAYCRKGHKQIKADAQGPERDFLNELEKAIAEAEIRDLQSLDKHSMGGMVEIKYKDKDGVEKKELHQIKSDWRAAAWRLSRKYPDRWGRKQIVKLEGNSEQLQRGPEEQVSSFKDATFQEQIINLIQEIEKDEE